MNDIERRIPLLLLLLCMNACGEAQLGQTKEEVNDRFGETQVTEVIEPINYTDQAYTFTGDDSIRSVIDLFELDDNVWYGVDDGVNIPFESPNGQCDRFNSINTLAELPKTIEGVITLHPRYFQKTSFCGADERYYASFVLEDSTGGILVLKDSRIADFTYGDRVKLRVRGLIKFFDTLAVLIHDGEEVVQRDVPVFYEEVPFRELAQEDIGRNYRMRGEIADIPTNANFSEMCLVPEGESYDACSYSCRNSDACTGYLLVTFDREIVQRDAGLFKPGDVIDITGPVVNSFGFRLLVARIGQVSFVNE